MLRSKMWWRLLLTPLLAGALSLLTYAQCEMCKTGLTKSPEGARMAEGFNNGILFLMAMPYLLVGTVALVIFVAHRK